MTQDLFAPRWVAFAEREPDVTDGRDLIVHVPRESWGSACPEDGFWDLAQRTWVMGTGWVWSVNGRVVQPTHWLEMAPPSEAPPSHAQELASARAEAAAARAAAARWEARVLEIEARMQQIRVLTEGRKP